MPINLSALNMFRSATNWDNKGVANLDHKYAVLNDHVYGGWLSSIGRDDDEKEANNKVRAELLRSLGLAFKLKGMSEDGDGRLRFSTGFMDRTKEVSDAAKAALRGKKCIMQDFSAEHELGQKVPEFKDADHLPIVNELTDELIDEIGPKAFREYFRVDPRGAKA